MSLMDAYVDNDNLFWLRGASIAQDGAIIATGVGQIVTIVDDTGSEIGGASFPITMICADTDNGHWVGQLPYAAELEDGHTYTATIQLTDDGTSARGHFETPFLGRTRTIA